MSVEEGACVAGRALMGNLDNRDSGTHPDTVTPLTSRF